LMTPKQILDSFSETLIQDERILSAPERALLGTVLHHARTVAGENPEIQEKVRSVIAAAVGETVAQRAFSLLGASVVERILEGSTDSTADPAGSRHADVYAGQVHNQAGAPQPPAPGAPQPPANVPRPGPGGAPQPPAPGAPQPPATNTRTVTVAEASVAVMERTPFLPAKCVVLDEFLAPQELEELTIYALQHEAGFQASTLVSPAAEGGVVNYEHRRSRVLMDLARHQDLILDRIKAVLPQVLDKLGIQEFPIAEIEAQITASNNGDFFLRHSDSGNERVASRRLTFVYFFHREPRQFEGGELRIHDARLEGGEYVSQGSYQTIVPQQNQIVFFPCELLHEITPVKCPSQLFADSRFTVNGWLRR
jgi:SM-20-related protein